MSNRKRIEPADLARKYYGKTLGVSGDLERYTRATDLFAEGSDEDRQFIVAHLLYLQLQESAALRGEVRRLTRLVHELAEDVSVLADRVADDGFDPGPDDTRVASVPSPPNAHEHDDDDDNDDDDEAEHIEAEPAS